MKPTSPEQIVLIAKRQSVLIAELEEERRWLLAEIQDSERTIRHYRRSLLSVEESIAALAGKGGAE